MAASMPEMAKVSMATRLASMPTSDAPSRFCAMAMMVEPITVLVRNRCSTTISTNAAAMMSSRCTGAVTPARSMMPL
ncbi:hypothetical protein D3C71_2088560 [compost metagenome]